SLNFPFLHSGIVAVKMQTLIQKATKVSGDDRCQLSNSRVPICKALFWSTLIDSRVHL
ncbi:hypothetical protein BS17DRAFT_788840, partial [Gyrodon lividus]